MINSDNVNKFLKDIVDLKMCPGNEDFYEILDDKLEGSTQVFKKAFVEDEDLNILYSYDQKSTIRVFDCEVLLSPLHQPNRCNKCAIFRKTLNVRKSRLPDVKSSAVKKNRPNCTLSHKQMRKKLFTTGKEIHNLKKKQHQLEKQIHKHVRKNGVNVDKDSQRIFSSIMDSHETELEKNSVMHLLWQQQKMPLHCFGILQ